jgi:DNA repair exonuclease SbcCD ATPase subunit
LVRDEKGRFAKKDETGVETPPVAEAAPAEPVPPTEPADRLPRDVYEPLKAIRDENKELKAQLAAIQQRLEAPQPQPQPVDFWDDPQSFMEQRFSVMNEQLLQQFEQRQTARRLDASEQAAKAKYADYSEAFSAFEQAVQLNPRLAQELAMAPDPGEFAYARGKTAIEIQKVGSIDELKKQIRAELEAEARAVIQPAPTLPSTTAADGSVGARTGPTWAGPTPLTQMLS